MPTQIYKDANGQRLPSVTTIISRFKNSDGLLYWANECGLNGQTLNEARRPAATAGTMAHALVEAHLHGRPEPQLEGDPEIIEKARAAFATYLEWKKTTRMEFLHTEVGLVSETHKFGGCLDAIGTMNGNRVLVDFKTSNSLYADYLYQLAAYCILWEENYPDHKIEGGFHLCRFSKDYGDFTHSFFPSLEDEKKTFLAMRDLYTRVKAAEKRVR